MSKQEKYYNWGPPSEWLEDNEAANLAILFRTVDVFSLLSAEQTAQGNTQTPEELQKAIADTVRSGYERAAARHDTATANALLTSLRLLPEARVIAVRLSLL